MKLVIAISVAFLVFIFSWILNALLMMGLALLATKAGVKPGFFLLINIFLIWVLSPGIGSGIAIYATGSKFREIDTNLIYVAFVTIVVVLLILIFLFSALVYSAQGGGYGNMILLLGQGFAVIVGARIGKNAVIKN